MLTLTVTAVNGAPASSPIVATFGPQGGTIGRNPGVTLVLPDPERTISRQQAVIRYEGGRFVFEESGANPSQVNGAPVGPGNRCALKHGDVLKIGPYSLVAAITSAAGADATNIFRPAAAAAPAVAGAVPALDPLLDPMAGFPPAALTAPQDPFAGLAPPPVMAPASAPPASTGPDPFAELFGTPAAAPAASSSPAAIPDDFDPFGMAPAARAPAAPAEPFSFGPPSDAAPSIDQLFGLGSAPKNPLDVLGQVSVASGGSSSASATDPLALFGGPAAPQGAGPALPNHTPEIHAAYAPPAAAPGPISSSDRKAMEDVLASVAPTRPNTVRTPVAAPAMPPADVPPASAPAYAAPHAAAVPPRAGAPTQQALIAALAEGLGARLDLPEGLNEEFMYRLGGLVHEAVQGTIDLLAARAVSKREVKAEATMIMERNNNPLKFSSDAAGALLFLLSGRLDPAFMPPLTAMRDAYNDLRSHQFGVMAGMRAALEGVLDRFTPQELEKRLTKKGMLDSLIPAARKAKLWDLYTEMYKEIAREAGDDFHKLFGKAFLKAYEEQVALLKQSPPPQR
jgi:FHA domain-containing protein